MKKNRIERMEGEDEEEKVEKNGCCKRKRKNEIRMKEEEDNKRESEGYGKTTRVC